MTNIEICTLTLSIIAILISLRSSSIAKKSYKLSVLDFNNKQSNFNIYLNDSYKIKLANQIFVLIHLSIFNKSESKNSFNAKLQLDIKLKNGEQASLYFEHLPNKRNNLSKIDFIFFERNINLSNKETITNWLLFEIPLSVYEDNEVEKYTVVISDLKNKTKKVNTSLLKELIDEN